VQATGDFVNSFNHHGYNETLDNLLPSDLYDGCSKCIPERRVLIKEQKLKMRKQKNLKYEMELDYIGSLP